MIHFYKVENKMELPILTYFVTACKSDKNLDLLSTIFGSRLKQTQTFKDV